MAFFEKLKKGMSKTRDNLSGKLNSVFSAFTRVDEDLMDELEETLILCDVGAATTDRILEELRERVKTEKLNVSETKAALKEILRAQMVFPPAEEKYPLVILVVGVNGVGKTTSIGKIAAYYKEKGKSVLLAAGDTFRAAATDQLSIWADRAGVPIVKYGEGYDPAAVIYDAIDSAKHRGTDVVICDTAGRLHNKKNLMNELDKIKRVIDREHPDAAKEVFLVLDGTTGQNAIVQAKEFAKVCSVTGIVLTKLDGTAKGGAVFAIKDELGVPVRFIGVGEGLDDLRPFDAKEFADSIID